MARKVTNYTVNADGRDKGKTFVITEMPASRAERWAFRALLALIQGGAELPAGYERLGMAGMAELGIRALSNLSPEVAEPLLDEMLSCVQVMPDTARPHIVRPLIEEDIEEVWTRLLLRGEVWKIHTDFLTAVVPSMLAQARTAATQKVGRNTKTSRRQSQPS